MVKLTEEQQAAADAAIDAIQGGQDEFAIGGLAGTGKTTTAEYIVKMLRSKVLAPTGKAVDALKTKGVRNAMTIHSFVYRFMGTTRGDDGRSVPIFEDRDSPLEESKSLVIDEASMVSADMARDIRQFEIPTIWIGDHGQLAPVGADPRIMENADVRLETIHRQAAENPIVRLAHAVRSGADFHRLVCDDDRVLFRSRYGLDAIVRECMDRNVDQLLCGFNNMRKNLNEKFRSTLGHKGSLCAGEKIICLLNSRSLGIFNGMVFYVLTVKDDGKPNIPATVQSQDGRVIDVVLYRPVLGRGVMFDDPAPDGVLSFDYAYCITVHKSQGSEWKSVALIDQQCNYWSAERWRYTGITRAKEQLIVYR